MRIGVPTEIKPDEYRVAITPAGVRELSAHGHEVLLQAGAGEGSAFSDADCKVQVFGPQTVDVHGNGTYGPVLHDAAAQRLFPLFESIRRRVELLWAAWISRSSCVVLSQAENSFVRTGFPE